MFKLHWHFYFSTFLHSILYFNSEFSLIFGKKHNVCNIVTTSTHNFVHSTDTPNAGKMPTTCIPIEELRNVMVFLFNLTGNQPRGKYEFK